MMWYGVLGTKELLHRTYRNLEQKVLLEVSGSLLALHVFPTLGYRALLLDDSLRCFPHPRPPAYLVLAKDWCILSIAFFSPSAFLWLSAMGARFLSPVFRELPSSTFPAMPEEPTSGGAPRKMMYVWGLRWVSWA